VLPLGAQVAKALMALRQEGLLIRDLPMVNGEPVFLPHPSGENAESIELLLNWRHDNAGDYAAERHARYLAEKAWLKKHKPNPQPESAYNAARVSRWQGVDRLRRHFQMA
jgi:hypothetical protein